MVNKLIANIYNLSSDERNGAVSHVRGGSMGKTNGQIFRGLYHGYYPHLCGMHNKKKHKKGDLDVLIQHNQWESTVSCYVHTHTYV